MCWAPWGRPMPEAAAHLAAWGLADAPARLVATRENTVYRVETLDGPAALRIRRPGYRTHAEIRSELAWMAALGKAGLAVPRPIPNRDGAYLHEAGGTVADTVTWVTGEPMGIDGALTDMPDLADRYAALGRITARLHDLSDAWAGAADVVRPSWDADGLLGAEPLWGRFWENPTLSLDDRALINTAKARAAAHLNAAAAELDYGLIHADLVPENVIFGPDGPALIDFDDSGWGFRAFELATIANRAMRHPDGPVLVAALIQGYTAIRPADIHALPLFQLLRAFTYLGWIIPRMAEPGGQARAARFRAFATDQARLYLETEGASHGG